MKPSAALCALVFAACTPDAPTAPTVPAVSSPAPAPVGPPLPPVAPGSYVNHVGNPAAGSWGPDGQWVWKNPESPEADSTWKYLAAAGAGAAGGAALSYMLSKSHFEQRHGQGAAWTRTDNVNDVHSYRDKHGKPISAEEYQRRKAQSERDRAAYRTRKAASLSTAERQRRQAQSARDRARSRSSSPVRSRSSSRRRR